VFVAFFLIHCSFDSPPFRPFSFHLVTPLFVVPVFFSGSPRRNLFFPSGLLCPGPPPLKFRCRHVPQIFPFYLIRFGFFLNNRLSSAFPCTLTKNPVLQSIPPTTPCLIESEPREASYLHLMLLLLKRMNFCSKRRTFRTPPFSRPTACPAAYPSCNSLFVSWMSCPTFSLQSFAVEI